MDSIYQDRKGRFYQKLHLSPDTPPQIIGMLIRGNYSDPVTIPVSELSKLKYICDRSEVAAGENSLCSDALDKLVQLAESKKSTPRRKRQ
jgi:hypothetical protein